MITEPASANIMVENKVATILTQGKDVRTQVAKMVMDAADKSPSSRKGLIELSRLVLDGAVIALDKSVSREPTNVLLQVIDGLGDGLSTAALATRLALEEAKAEEQRFAEDDLTKMTQDLRTVGELFVEVVSQAANKLKSKTGSEFSELRKTMTRVLPSINSALVTISEHPLQFGKDSVLAGFKMSRQALGSLFAAIGHQFQKAGKQLIGERSA